MILTDEQGSRDTREEVTRPGPYCDGMAMVLDRLYMDGDFGIRYESTPDGGGAVQYGRRVLYWDSNGFISSQRYASLDQADAALNEAFPFTEDE